MTTDPFPISILSAGRGWLVVEKPSGLSVQEEQGQDLRSVLRSRVDAGPDLFRGPEGTRLAELFQR